MILIALDDEQKDLLILWLHYLIRKMELRKDFGNNNAYQGLKSIQEQLLHPKKVFIGTESFWHEPMKIIVEDENIFLEKSR